MRILTALVCLATLLIVARPAVADDQEDNKSTIDSLINEVTVVETASKTAADTAEFVRMYRQLAEMGNAYGQYLLGQAYDFGWAMARDTVTAYQWYLKSAEQKNHFGLRWVGQCKIEGWGTDIDITSGILFLEQAADSGNTGAAAYLGGLYFYTNSSIERDDYLAEEYLTIAANAGDLESQKSLVALYADPQGELFDDSLGILWTEKIIAQRREPLYLCILGDYYRNSAGVEQDYVRAGNLYYEAAMVEYAYAEEELGWLYFAGSGTDSNFIQSYAWANRSVNHIHTSMDTTIALANVHELLDSLATHLTPEEMDSAKTLTPGWSPVSENSEQMKRPPKKGR